MKMTKKTVRLFSMMIIGVLAFFSIAVLAQEIQPEPELGLGGFFSGIIADYMQTKSATSGASSLVVSMGLVAVGIRALLSTMKVSVLKAMLWDKMAKDLQGLMPMFLSLSLVIVGAFGTGQVITGKGVLLALFTGAGASKLHDILQYIEALPGINSTVKALIDLGQKLLGGK